MSSISSTAIALRKSLAQITSLKMRSLVHLVANEPDRSTISYAAMMDPETDVMLTSFVSQGLYFEGLGGCWGGR